MAAASDPSLGVRAKVDAAKRGIAGVVAGVLSGRPNRIMAPSPRKLVMTPPCATTSRSTSAWKSVEQSRTASGPSVSLSAVKPERSMKTIAASCGPAPSRKSGIPGQPLAKRRRLKLLQQSLFMAKYCACRRFSQSCTAPNRIAGGTGGRERQRCAQPDAARKRRKVGDRRRSAARPRSAAGRSRCAARRAGPPAAASARPRGRRRRPRRAVAQQPVAGHQMRDGRRNHLDARHDRIERRGKHVAAAGDGRADHDDAVLERTSGGDLAVQHRGRADGADGAAAAVEGQRQNMIDIGRDMRLSASVSPSASMTGSAPVASAAARNGNDSSTCRRFETASAAPRGVPDVSGGQVDDADSRHDRRMPGAAAGISPPAAGAPADRARPLPPTAIASGNTAAAAITVGTFAERQRQRCVTPRVAAIDQQQVDCDDARLEAGDPSTSRGKSVRGSG